MLECVMTDHTFEPEPYDRPILRPLEGVPIDQRKQEDLAALELLQEWMVVVRVVVIHLDLGRAADSGLFGLSGDEIIQVVDANLPLTSQLYELAEHCERGASAVTTAQDFVRMSADDMDAMVKRVTFKVSTTPRWGSACGQQSCSGCVHRCVITSTRLNRSKMPKLNIVRRDGAQAAQCRMPKICVIPSTIRQWKACVESPDD
jgi:hypothetical protein